jgi:hypothetical protein
MLTFLCDAVQSAGGSVIATSRPVRAPFLLSLETSAGERIGLAVYAFRSSVDRVLGRASDEHRLQIRYEAEKTWSQDHALGADPMRLDITLVLGLDLKRDVFIGLDPRAYDPLPMGISFEYTDYEVALVQRDGWHVWERLNRPGRRREVARVVGLETVVGFLPHRLIDYARFEREASELRLDPPIRYRAAELASQSRATGRHALEQQFELSAMEILEIIGERNRLKVAVKGGVAERHLGKLLAADPQVVTVRPIDRDGQPDFEVELVGGRRLLIECKNVSPNRYGNGDLKVEVQKTRATQGEPLGRLYRIGQWDVLGACLWSVTGRWEFRFRRAEALAPHAKDPSRIHPYQRVDATWSSTVSGGV